MNKAKKRKGGRGLNELERLFNQKTKAENLIEKQKSLTPKQMSLYVMICKRIKALEVLKMLQNTAPLSMDPEKILQHWQTSKSIFLEVEPNPNEELKTLLQNGSNVFEDYKPQTVQNYNMSFSKFVKQFVVLWKKQNNYK